MVNDLEKNSRLAVSVGRRALLMACADEVVKAVVAGLRDEFDFDVVDAAPLSNGLRYV